MTYLNFDESTTKTIDGVEFVALICEKCGGSGYLPGYEHVDNARCWGSCRGQTGPIGWRNREDFERVIARREKDAKRAARRLQDERDAQAARWSAWVEESAEIVEGLRAYEGHSSFLVDLAAKVAEEVALSDAQVEAGLKTLAAEVERVAAEIDVPEGRQEVEGKVLSVKEVRDTFSYYDRWITKVVVDCGGFRIFGTLPSSIGGAERGDRVAFTATLEAKERGFGFYKRPTKAKVLDPVA